MRRKDLAKVNKLKTLFALNYEDSETNEIERVKHNRPGFSESEGVAFEVCELCGIPTDEYTQDDGRVMCTECAEL